MLITLLSWLLCITTCKIFMKEYPLLHFLAYPHHSFKSSSTFIDPAILAAVRRQRPVCEYGQCSICGLAFDHADALVTHMIARHNPRWSLPHHSYLPTQCQQATPTHPAQEAVFTCNLCGDLFPAKDNLKNHMDNQHCAASAHMCSECEHFFESVKALKNHIRTYHPGVEPQMCRMCDRLFRNRRCLGSAYCL